MYYHVWTERKYSFHTNLPAKLSLDTSSELRVASSLALCLGLVQPGQNLEEHRCNEHLYGGLYANPADRLSTSTNAAQHWSVWLKVHNGYAPNKHTSKIWYLTGINAFLSPFIFNLCNTIIWKINMYVIEKLYILCCAIMCFMKWWTNLTCYLWPCLNIQYFLLFLWTNTLNVYIENRPASKLLVES